MSGGQERNVASRGHSEYKCVMSWKKLVSETEREQMGPGKAGAHWGSEGQWEAPAGF